MSQSQQPKTATLSPFLKKEISFDDLCYKLHEIIDNEYSMETLFSVGSVSPEISYLEQASKVIDIWANISPGDMAAVVVRQKLIQQYISEREFQERWYSIGVRMQTWLHSCTDIDIKTVTEFVLQQLSLPVQSDNEMLPAQYLSPRVEANDGAVKALGNKEMFWYTCLILGRLSLEKSGMYQKFLKLSIEPATKKPVRREAKVRTS